MTTPLDLINLSLKKTGVIGVGQTALDEDVNDAFTELNMMLSQWNRKRWMIYHLLDLSIVSTAALSYSVGVGGDINTPRPDRLEFAYYRQIQTQTPPNQVDFPLQILESREDYSRIRLKQLQAISQYVWYDAGYPLGYVYPWPVLPANQYELHIGVKAQLSQFSTLADTFNFPPEYELAIIYNLSARLRPSYQLPPDPSLTALAIDALNTITNANAQVPRLRMPRNLVRPALYNLYSDQNY